MKAFWFRVIGNDGKPTGYVGFAMGECDDALFVQIDQFVDAFLVEIKEAKMAGFCMEIDEDEDEYEIRNLEVGFEMPLPSDNGWKKPVWSDKVV